MGKKNDRQKKLLSLIAEEAIETQEEIISRLSAEGYEVTQATVSRDIRELHLVKAVDENGVYRYTEKASGKPEMPGIHNAITDSVISIESAGNILVIKTIPGLASAVAACVDSIKTKEILGCIAGDDTIFVAVRDAFYAAKLSGELFSKMKNI